MVYLRKITTYNNFWLQRIIYTCEFLIQQSNCRMATGQSKIIEQQMSVMSHCTAGCHRRTDDSTRTIPRLLAQTDKTLPVPEISFNVIINIYCSATDTGVSRTPISHYMYSIHLDI